MSNDPVRRWDVHNRFVPNTSYPPDWRECYPVKKGDEITIKIDGQKLKRVAKRSVDDIGDLRLCDLGAADK